MFCWVDLFFCLGIHHSIGSVRICHLFLTFFGTNGEKNRWAGQLFCASTILDVEASVHLILLLVFKLVSRYKNKKLGKE